MFNFPDPAVFIPLIFALGVLPVALVMVTSYAKIFVVLSLLKNALGLQQVPPAIVTNGLALLLTWYVMYPVGQAVMKAVEAQQPAASASQPLNVIALADRGKEPLRAFLDKHAAERERVFFVDAAHRLMGPEVAAEVTP